ncbi:MAG: hypothetical protein IJ257_03175 [Treponema sp.]|nr:hypothetical protein [Treponema sp.]
MKTKIKYLLGFFILFTLAFSSFADESDTDSLGSTITSEQGHRFIEARGAIPLYPALTFHGLTQSFVAGFSDFAGTLFSAGKSTDSITPDFATDLNITVFPPMADYRLGFMAGVAIDKWEQTFTRNSVKTSEDIYMNFYYVGLHVDYGHWVFSDIGTRLSIYGEFAVGSLTYDDSGDSEAVFGFDICPIGIQFCPEKHIGIYIEFPHLGSRPFFQTGLSIGL